MHAVEEETFKWPHFCSILKDFLLRLASREWIRSLFSFLFQASCFFSFLLKSSSPLGHAIFSEKWTLQSSAQASAERTCRNGSAFFSTRWDKFHHIDLWGFWRCFSLFMLVFGFIGISTAFFFLTCLQLKWSWDFPESLMLRKTLSCWFTPDQVLSASSGNIRHRVQCQRLRSDSSPRQGHSGAIHP